MNILNKLSVKNLKLNKKRTISTIVGITLSVALICAVATLFSSFQATLVQNAINETGYFHLGLFNVTDENINELKNNRDIKDIYTVNEIGYANLENSKNPLKPYLKLKSMDKAVFEKLSLKLIEGRFASNSNELVISNHIKTNARVEYKVGDKIKLNVGKRMSLDDYELGSYNMYNEADEKLVDCIEREFTIVGIIERPDNSFEEYAEPGYTIITTGIDSESKNSYIVLKNPMEHNVAINRILGIKEPNKEDLSEDDYKDLKYDNYMKNRELLRWEVFAFSDSTVSMLYILCIIVVGIILFTSVFCIRNSFAIATTEKIKMYGMLASVGATKKQIKKNVIFESFLLGIIGIPLGLISGIFAVFLLTQIVSMLLGERLLQHVDGIIFNVSIIPVLISVILGIITIYFSAISSARKASKVSPIESLKNTNDIKIKGKKLKSPKIISKIFKTGGELAYKNLKRSRKKYRTTVISITVSIVIFITMNSFITNMIGFSSNYYTLYDYNIELYNNLENLSDQDIKKITSLSDIDEYFISYQEIGNYIKIFDIDKVNQTGDTELIEDYTYDENTGEKVNTGKGKVANLSVIALDDATFKKYAKKIGKDYEKIKSTGVLNDMYKYYDESSDNVKETRRYKYSENDIIKGEYKNKAINIKVGAVNDIKPYGFEQTYNGGGYLIVNKDEHKDFEFEMYEICIKSSNPDKLQKDLESLNFDFKIRNIDKEAKEQESMILVINIFIYGFITVITLIGVTNIFNTITSNMELRQKEFAMLKSIGMTKKEFNRMINLETIFYGTKSLIYGIILGLLGTFAIYKAFSVKIDSGIYIPVVPIIISIIFVFVIVFVIMKYSISKINRQNTIETIRNENI